MSSQLLTSVRRFPFIGASVLVAILALAANLWILDKAQAYDRELEDLNRQGDTLLEIISNRSLLERELDLVKLAVNRTEDNLVVPDNLAENLWYFYSIESRTQTRLTDLRQLDPAPQSGAKYQLIPYELRVSGTFRPVTEFLRQLETGPRLLHLSEFSLKRQPGSVKNLTLELEFELLGRK